MDEIIIIMKELSIEQKAKAYKVMKVEKHCGYCKHCFLGSHNNYWCDCGGRGTVREPWGFVWKVNANKCKDFEVKEIYKNIEFK